MTAKSWHIEEGKPYPMGATLTSKGANFTLFSINAEKVELCLFDKGKEPVWRCLRGAVRYFTDLCRTLRQGSDTVFACMDVKTQNTAHVLILTNC